MKVQEAKIGSSKRGFIHSTKAECMLRSCPLENHKLFQAEADDTTCLFSEDLVVEECELSPHPVAVEVPTGWSIIGENVVLLETQDLITALSCLLSIYHIFDLNYHPSGQKCLIFASVALAEIPTAQKLPVRVQSLLCNMKRLKQC